MLQNVVQILAAEQLHRKIRAFADGQADFVDGHDIGMFQRGGNARLAEEPPLLGGTRGIFAQHRERHITVGVAIMGALHQFHPAGAHLPGDVILLGRRGGKQIGRCRPIRRQRGLAAAAGLAARVILRQPGQFLMVNVLAVNVIRIRHDGILQPYSPVLNTKINLTFGRVHLRICTKSEISPGQA